MMFWIVFFDGNLAASNFLPCFLMFLVYITLGILTETFTNEIHSAKKNQLQVARIGEVISGSGIVCTKDGAPFEYTDPGYRHF